jgi:hypothetical protein
VASIPSAPADLELIEQLKGRLQFAELKIQVLEERLRLVRIAKYGPGSEKFSDAQLALLELEPGVSGAEVQAESERPAVQPTAKKTRNHPGRQELPANLRVSSGYWRVHRSNASAKAAEKQRQ